MPVALTVEIVGLNTASITFMLNFGKSTVFWKRTKTTSYYDERTGALKKNGSRYCTIHN